MPTTPQDAVDQRNARFWDELCGSSLARRLGIEDASAESLALFDDAYLEQYPYLAGYMPEELVRGRDVLEIGLGYGTLCSQLAARGARYNGVDIAAGPVEMARHRLRLAGAPDGVVCQGSALELPFDDGRFDAVFSIGCLHHTGDLPRAVSEVHRVLRPQGTAVVMLYNRRSLRRFRRVMLPRLVGRGPSAARARALYDANATGEAAPHTDYVARAEARRLFGAFTEVRVDIRNFDALMLPGGRIRIPRERLLGNVDRLLGLDLYVTAVK